MDTLSYRTRSVNKENADKKWLLVDAEGQSLGRFASKVAHILRGKHKPAFTPHDDCGDFVVVINAEKVALSGSKIEDKEYVRHTGYPGGQRFTAVREMLNEHPERVIEKAVRGMLPKTKLGDAVFKNLYVYAGTEHRQDGQKPVKIDINTIL